MKIVFNILSAELIPVPSLFLSLSQFHSAFLPSLPFSCYQAALLINRKLLYSCDGYLLVEGEREGDESHLCLFMPRLVELY